MRWNVSGAVLSLAILLTACANPLDQEPSRAEIPTGCGECVDEIAALVEEVEAIEGVEAVRDTRRTTRGVPVAHLRVGLDLAGDDVVSTDIAAVTDAVAEAAWHSDVSPLDVLSLDVALRNGYHESDGYAFGADRTSFEERWGERPAGSEWSPVPEQDDDLEGCEVDGCQEQMRHIAREVSGLPGIEAVIASTYAPDSPTSSAHTSIEVRGDGADVAERVAEVVWRSEVGPLVHIDVTVDTPGDDFPETVTFRVDALAKRWGPRPVA